MENGSRAFTDGTWTFAHLLEVPVSACFYSSALTYRRSSWVH